MEVDYLVFPTADGANLVVKRNNVVLGTVSYTATG